MLDDRKSIAAIIVTYNGMKTIDKCIQSVLNSSLQCRLIVVDNHSTDGTAEHIERKYGIPIIKNKRNLGFGKANNIGISVALREKMDYIYLLNQDAWLFEDTLKVLVEQMAQNNKYAILSSMHITESGEQLEFHFSRYLLVSHLDRIFSDYFLTKTPFPDIYEVDFVNAAGWLLDARKVRSVGGFNPVFPHYGEDTEYVIRTRHRGFAVGISTRVKMTHACGQTPKRYDSSLNYFYVHLLSFGTDIRRDFVAANLVVAKQVVFQMVTGLFLLKPRNLWLGCCAALRYAFSLREIYAGRLRATGTEGAFLTGG